MTTTSKDEHRASIARLVAQGKMTHEKPGQYIPDSVDAKSRKAIPEYDVEAVRKALPDVLQLNFDEVDGEGCFVVLEDGKTGESSKIPIGKSPPKTTAELIEVIRAHFRQGLDLKGMDEAAEVFDAIEKTED